MAISIQTPLSREEARKLKAGDSCLLSGVIYTARDAAHKRLCQLIEEGRELPVDLKDSVFYFVGTKLVHTADVAYGEVIPEYVYEPTEEGDVFVGWIGESYDTMPAHDVTYTANITNDVLQLIIDNSQLTIYDLSGRKIEVDDLRELEKGVYVVNGRKVVINNK